MKFCYIDESGTGEEPYAVMVGIIADAYRMHITKIDWTWLLDQLSKILDKQIFEIHTSDFYAGNGIWRRLDGNIRAKIISLIFNWLKERNHKIVFTSIDKAKFYNDFDKEPQSTSIPTLWCFMALHICLALQKCHQSIPQNKGNTLLIFDKKETDMDKFIKLMMDCPDWIDTYYGRKPNQAKLDQIIDVPYFADSRHVGLIQIADFVSFFLRRYIEMMMGIEEKYDDEAERIEEWTSIALNQSVQSSFIYPKIRRRSCADLFYRYAPSCLLRNHV